MTSYYIGATVNTPIKAVKVGAAYDYAGGHGHGAASPSFANAISGYVSWQMTEKLSLHCRGEYASTDTGVFGPIGVKANGDPEINKIAALTATLQYDLWKNVISRLEVRYDHLAGEDPVGYGGENGNYTVYNDNTNVTQGQGQGSRNQLMFAFNIIYKF
jgi:hypothetical protein